MQELWQSWKETVMDGLLTTDDGNKITKWYGRKQQWRLLMMVAAEVKTPISGALWPDRNETDISTRAIPTYTLCMCACWCRSGNMSLTAVELQQRNTRWRDAHSQRHNKSVGHPGQLRCMDATTSSYHCANRATVVTAVIPLLPTKSAPETAALATLH